MWVRLQKEDEDQKILDEDQSSEKRRWERQSESVGSMQWNWKEMTVSRCIEVINVPSLNCGWAILHFVCHALALKDPVVAMYWLHDKKALSKLHVHG